MKTIVVSAVNLKVGGTLTILRDCLRYLSCLAESGEYRIVALVYQREVADYPNIEYVEMQWPKKNWINRLWCEYITMRKISNQLAPVYLWLSLHDTTSNVKAERRAVYCHNSFPFYRWRIREILFTPKVVLFSLFSKYAYRINIHRNTYVIVQQQWFREAFARWFGLSEKKIIVAPPTSPHQQPKDFSPVIEEKSSDRSYSFMYAAAPDSHKNFECICRAAKLLEQWYPKLKYKVYMTVKGDENGYARWLYAHWGKEVPALEFIGYLNKERLYAYYRQSDCLIFPSKVETWGLPITEFSAFEKPMLLADLPYAHETAGGCKRIAFFNPDQPDELAVQMKQLVRGYDTFLSEPEIREIKPPMAGSWDELFYILLK